MEQSNTQAVCDLHTHTLASDGMQSPADNVRLAAQKGLAAVAITDHDTVAGIAEALEAGQAAGITVVPGVEISTRAGGKDIHILGYYIDYMDEVFLNCLAELRSTRDARNNQIIHKLQQLGISITLEDVIQTLGRELVPDETLGRPHIADALVKKGVVSNMREAFDRYLAEGAPAFVSVPRIRPEDACNWIREAGGAPVLAHPGLYGDDALSRDILHKSHFAGIEVHHSDHGPAEIERYDQMAQEFKLVITGGSDFHGIRQGEVFHGDLGSRTVGVETLAQLKERAGLSK